MLATSQTTYRGYKRWCDAQRAHIAGRCIEQIRDTGFLPAEIVAERFRAGARCRFFDAVDVRLRRLEPTHLRATRDLLLPRLISGEIDVTDLDIAVPELAA